MILLLGTNIFGPYMLILCELLHVFESLYWQAVKITTLFVWEDSGLLERGVKYAHTICWGEGTHTQTHIHAHT